jgi:HAD superfamily hydrolase (TIGR01509 family)
MKTRTPNASPVHDGPNIPWNRIRGWFFDLDGTLMDTDDQVVERLAGRLGFLGKGSAQTISRYLVMESETWINTMVTLLDLVGLDSWVFALRRRLSRRVRPTFRLIPNVHPMLQELSARGKMAVVSTRPMEDAETFLRQHNLTGHFDLVVAQETTKRLKPHPQPVRYAADTLNLPLDTCVMVGDTPVDVRSARKAGAWAVGVLCGFGEAHELQRAGAHHVLATTGDLLSLIEDKDHSNAP